MRFVSTIGAAAALGVFAGPALADFGVPAIWNDFQPAVSTQYRGPDGGRRYDPPNTATLVQQRTQLDTEIPPTNGGRRNSPPDTRQSQPLPPGTPTNPATKPPSQVGR